MVKVLGWLRSCVKGEGAVSEMPDDVCSEIDAVIERVYGSPKCLSLEIQALYTINLLAKELIIEAKQPTFSHVEAIIATIKGWGQIKNFGLIKEPTKGITIIKGILSIPMPGGKTLREYALEASILDLKDDLTILEKTVRDVLNHINSRPATWKYKMIHLLLSALYPPFDNNIAEILFGESISVSNYAGYLRCLRQLAEWYVSECGNGFERVKGFGYARKLSVDIGVGRVELYLPLTRLLDFVVWSAASPKDDKTLYEYFMDVCTA